MSDDLDCSRRHGAKTIIAPVTKASANQNESVHHDTLRERADDQDTSRDVGEEGLDTPLSAMQSATIKTALIINKQPVVHDYVSIEEDLEEDCFSRHWIFRRKVGFDADAETGVKDADGHDELVAKASDGESFISSETDILKLEEEKEQLLKQLEAIRQTRAQLQQTHSQLKTSTEEWTYHLSSATRSNNLASSELQSVKTRKAHIQNEYSLAQKWHVLGDAFFIWHNGPFATINGTRFGRGAKTAFSRNESNGSNRDNKNPLFSWGDSNARQIPTSVTIPFHEINSALGQVVFLLYTLQNTNSGISFHKHVLQPCGHASKIGFLKNPKVPAARQQQQHTHYGERRRIFTTPDEITWYNLHHYEENGSYLSMGYYARRNFNTALEGLVYCIAEACLVVEKRDMALCVPYSINAGGFQVGREKEKGSSTTVGGLKVEYDPEEGERWTTVWRYLLTDLKWVIAYVAKHVDR